MEEKLFDFHPDAPVAETTREAIKVLYKHFLTLPAGNERDLAMEKLAEALFWSIKSLEING